MQGKELTELLCLTPEHISRLEKGNLPVSDHVMALLGSMALDMTEGRTATRAVLTAMKRPTKLGKRVTVKIPAAGALT